MGAGRQVLHGAGQPHGDGEAGKCRGFGTGGSWADSPISAAVQHRAPCPERRRDTSISVCVCARGFRLQISSHPPKIGLSSGLFVRTGSRRLGTPDVSPMPM